MLTKCLIPRMPYSILRHDFLAFGKGEARHFYQLASISFTDAVAWND